MARLSSRKRIFFFSQQIPSLCTWHRDEGPRFQQSGGSLFLPHVHRRASLFCLNLGRLPSGGRSRWRWRGPWPSFVGQTGEHHEQTPWPHRLCINNNIILSIHQCAQHTLTHMPTHLRKPILLGLKHMIIIFVMLCRKKRKQLQNHLSKLFSSAT